MARCHFLIEDNCSINDLKRRLQSKSSWAYNLENGRNPLSARFIFLPALPGFPQIFLATRAHHYRMLQSGTYPDQEMLI